jgi:hypothetical protein
MSSYHDALVQVALDAIEKALADCRSDEDRHNTSRALYDCVLGMDYHYVPEPTHA